MFESLVGLVTMLGKSDMVDGTLVLKCQVMFCWLYTWYICFYALLMNEIFLYITGLTFLKLLGLSCFSNMLSRPALILSYLFYHDLRLADTVFPHFICHL